jgi:plasmid maintenance system killer protein
MDLSFENKKAQKTFESKKLLTRNYGRKIANKVMSRLKELEAVDNLNEVSPTCRPHQLQGDMLGKIAVDLDKKLRLIFKPRNSNLPYKLCEIKEIVILEIVDYH